MCFPVLTLVVEAVDAVDGGALVVATQQKEVFWVFDLVGQQQTDGLQRLLPSIHVISQEEIVRLRRKTTVLKQPQQVCVLTMDIACEDERPIQIIYTTSVSTELTTLF